MILEIGHYSPRTRARLPKNQSAPKLENRRTPQWTTSPCSPRAPDLLHVLPSRMVGWSELCNPDNLTLCLGRARINFTGYLLQIQQYFFSQALWKLIDYEGHIYNSKLHQGQIRVTQQMVAISYQIIFQMYFSVLIWIGLGQKLSLHLSILIACRTNGLHMIYQQDFISQDLGSLILKTQMTTFRLHSGFIAHLSLPQSIG